MGLIGGLEKALEMKIKTVTIHGDSKLIINQLAKVYKVNSPNIIEYYNTAKGLCKKFDKIYIGHVYREFNKRADQLANEGCLLKE